MAKYVLVYYGGSMPETEAEQAVVMKKWGDWFGGLGPAIADGGNPFSGQANTVSSNGSISSGPIGSPPATGYSIVEAASLDAATDMAKGCPLLSSGGDIAVYETFNVM
jgi:hypothetical protein